MRFFLVCLHYSLQKEKRLRLKQKKAQQNVLDLIISKIFFHFAVDLGS